MKSKIVPVFVFVILFQTCSFAQSRVGRSSSKVFDSGNIVVDAYYGFPNIFTQIWKSQIAAYYSNGYQGYEVSADGLGPLGGKVTYLLNRTIGLGLEANYVTSDIQLVFNDAGTVYFYKYTFLRYRVMGVMDINYAETQNFDAYASVRMGYLGTQEKFTSNIPSATQYLGSYLPPVAFGITAGCRIFFSDMIGAHFEIGLGGGPLLKGGLSFKLSGKRM